MYLKGKTLQTILKLDEKDISHDDGVTTTINKLNSLYNNSKIYSAFKD